MKISIIIPTYQPKSYIFECFNSLVNQSCSKNYFEVIIVLNGDKEPYYSEMMTYLNKSKLYYKLIYTPKKGVSNARNIGIDYAIEENSKYIMFLDDDDKISHVFIEDCLSKASPDYVVICNVKTFINDNDVVYGNDYISKCYYKNKDKEYNIFNYRSFFSSVCAKLIPTDIIGNIRFDESFKIGEDSLFGFKISKNIDKCILSDENSIYYRRIRIGSASRSDKRFKYKLKNAYMLILAYSKIYFSDFRKYNVLFYSSRIFASISKVFK
jgi:glycosyltransferase involved in cell wall biosynthesis